jgi:hypothetical protein
LSDVVASGNPDYVLPQPAGQQLEQIPRLQPMQSVVELPDGALLVPGISGVVPNYRLLPITRPPEFDGTVDAHDKIVNYNAHAQAIGQQFDEILRKEMSSGTREEQVAALLRFKDHPLRANQILQVAQELSLRGAHNEVVDFLETQKGAAVANNTVAFFASDELKQWEAVELKRAGRDADTVRFCDNLLAADPKNTEAWRTRTMALVSQAGPDHVAAMAAFEEGFAKTGNYSLGMGALNAAMETGDLARAGKLAPLVSLAAKNFGADQAITFWPALVNAEATAVVGDVPAAQQAMLRLVDVLGSKNENGTQVVSDADKKTALNSINQILKAQPDKPGLAATLTPVKERLEMSLGQRPEQPLPYQAQTGVDETFAERGYHSRAGMTPDGFYQRGNVRRGNMLADSSTTLRDKMQFLEVAQTSLEKFVDSGLIRGADLPPGVDPHRSLSEIGDLETRIKASQTLVRGMFDVDERKLEDLHGLDHKIYDSVVRLRIEHSGATSLMHLTGQELRAYNALKEDEDLYKAVQKGEVTPEQRAAVEKLLPSRDSSLDPVASARDLIKTAELFRTSDTRTNITVTAEQGIGDCRHVAAATEALVSAVQQAKTGDLVMKAAQSLRDGDDAAVQGFTEAAGRELNGYEMRIYDQALKAPVEVAGKYEPVLTADGRFVAAANSEPQLIETHMHDVVRIGGAGEASKYVVADSFYETGPYRMGWVENDAPEVFSEKGLNKLRLSGGEVEAVVCRRDANGALEKDGRGFPIPVLDEQNRPVTVKLPLTLESTEYSSPSRLKVGTPTPGMQMLGVDVAEPSLAEALQNPNRPAEYARQAKFVVDNYGTPRVKTQELEQEELPAARARVAELTSPEKMNSIPLAERAAPPPVLDYEAAAPRPEVLPRGPAPTSVIMGLGMTVQAAGELAGPQKLTTGQKVTLLGQTASGLAQTGLEFAGPSMVNGAGGPTNFTGIGNNITGDVTAIGRLGGGLGALGGGFGMYSSAVGFKESWDSGSKTGMVMSGSNFVASTAFAVGGVAQVLGNASLAADSTGVGVCIGVPLQVAGLGFQLYDLHEQSAYMKGLMDSRLSDEAQQSHGGYTNPAVYVPGVPLKPEFTDYRGLLSLRTELMMHKTEYADGSRVSLDDLKGDPQRMTELARFFGGQYDKGVKDRQGALDDMGSWRHSSTIGQFSDYLRRNLRNIDDQATFEHNLDVGEHEVALGTSGRAALQELTAGPPDPSGKPQLVGYAWRLEEYNRRLAPLEGEYPGQLAELQKLRNLHIGLAARARVPGSLDPYVATEGREAILAERKKVEAMSPAAQEEYFSKNRQFLQKAGIDENRPDLALIGLSTSRAQYEAKAAQFAPAALEGEAQQALAQNAKTLATVNSQAGQYRDRLKALAKALPGVKSEDMPVAGDGGGKPASFRDAQAALARGIKEAQAKLDTLKADPAQDPDAKARADLQAVAVQAMQVEFANNENRNLAYKLQAYDRQAAALGDENAALRQDMAKQGLDRIAVTPDAGMQQANQAFADSRKDMAAQTQALEAAQTAFDKKFGDRDRQAELLKKGDPAYVRELGKLEALQFQISLDQIGAMQAENSYLKGYQALAQKESAQQNTEQNTVAPESGTPTRFMAAAGFRADNPDEAVFSQFLKTSPATTTVAEADPGAGADSTSPAAKKPSAPQAAQPPR